ncbi:Ferric/cupric reductase transmembrane component 2 [Colletotrichum orbiculare MAFF 240422]|uniref:ferric-chelate reductase (NADPH) n=1 Tax=Colletotrichum orbiculare (strain 104-T / ATCC 96160 / CBS 514.97 / LARS 414 / MAFF 240422) TaxID=1213857 RepID=N4VJ39_COLOR|nr:Ferric/cupric reductase transmembrane component 2 [Colletotrichum orbiculare MAFF 240422]
MDQQAAPAAAASRLLRRVGYQSQNTSSGGLVDYWGYAARVVPCTNDPGTCEYFESVYGGHERGMLYTGIIWATLGGILLIWAVGRHFWSPRRAAEVPVTKSAPTEKQQQQQQQQVAGKPRDAGLGRLGRAFAATVRSYTLPESVRSVFGRTTRLQVVILAALTAYLAVFSFIGIWYKDWTTPVKGYADLYQRRSWLGSWSDRVGTLAYALTPFSVMLASRESVLSQLTGVPYQSFNFLHRWLGWIMAVQALAHTIGWTVIEAVFYQPQPKVADKWIKQLYMIWGCVAAVLLLLIVVLATPWGIRLTGYEFFRKSHYVLAMVYIGACWGHWEPLKVFMVPGLAIWLVDRAARLVRSFLIHYQYLPDGTMGFQTAPAAMTLFPDPENGDLVRLDFAHPHAPWKPGQHFYLCFAKSSVWQSHPMTPLNLPVERGGSVSHAYVFRAKGGETRKIAQLAAASAPSATTPVILQGPYGEDHTLHLTPDVNVLCVAGGTGITYVLPVLHWLVSQPPSPDRRITLVWAVRLRQDIEWVRAELDALRAAKAHGVNVVIHVTREAGQSRAEEPHSAAEKKETLEGAESVPSDSSRSSASLSNRGAVLEVHAAEVHPDMAEIVPAFLAENVRGRTSVIASGPGAMISDLRAVVAAANSGGQVWKGNEMADVELMCDNRLEW